MSDIASVEIWSGKGPADENFPVGSVLIRRDLRPHVLAFYTFARNADDIADSATLAPDDKVSRLDTMEAVLLGHADGGSPSARLLRETLPASGVAVRHSRDLLRAFRQDAVKTRYSDWDELLDYCRYSAMPVGRHVLDLHGEAPESHAPSDALCAALQVLNHLQDCAGDLAALDRCYLPQDRMAQAGVGIGDLRATAASPGLRIVFNQLLDQVDKLNIEARQLPVRVKDRRLRLETAIIVGVSVRLAARLRRQDPLAQRVKLSKLDLAACAASALRWLP